MTQRRFTWKTIVKLNLFSSNLNFRRTQNNTLVATNDFPIFFKMLVRVVHLGINLTVKIDLNLSVWMSIPNFNLAT